MSCREILSWKFNLSFRKSVLIDIMSLLKMIQMVILTFFLVFGCRMQMVFT